MNDFTWLPDLASRLVGGAVVYANDEFFGPREALIRPEPPGFQPATFGAKGQVYDGWETRRRRQPGHDIAIVRLGVPGVIRGVVVDTAFFRGNYPPEISVEACTVDGHPTPEEVLRAAWTPVVPRSRITGDQRHLFAVHDDRRFTHVRLSIYPDGGVARLRVHAEPVGDPRWMAGGWIDLIAVEHGGLVVACSDQFYGSPHNLLMPGPARSMGEGWETARRRTGGNDWVEVRLGVPGIPKLVELDTSHFKGNAPEAARLTATDLPTGGQEAQWWELLPRTALVPDSRHRFPIPAEAQKLTSRIRLDVYPDGGMARMRLWGEPSATGLAALGRRWEGGVVET